MKNLKIRLILFSVVMLLLAGGCSRIDENLPQDPKLTIHDEDNMIASSPNFHGTVLYNKKWNYAGNCMQCHAANYMGGLQAPSCTKCHHTESYFHFDSTSSYNKALFDNTSPFFHGKLVTNIESSSFAKCQKCHGTTYAGGKSGKSCLTCHSQAKGPEACNTCHGVPSDTTGAPATGLHAAHLTGAVNASNVACVQCHTQYTTFSQVGHIDKTAGVDLVWGTLAKTKTNDPANNNDRFTNDANNFGGVIAPAPKYDMATKSCQNTYCHGNFKAGNTSNAPTWTASGTPLKCGSCHGDGNNNPSPNKGAHSSFTIANCNICHDNVSYTNGTYQITNKAKHIDGKLRLFGQDYAF